MIRLKQVRPRELIAALKRVGFIEAGQIGSHYILVDETRNIQTSVPIHSGDIGRGLLKKILKQVQLTEEGFRKIL